MLQLDCSEIQVKSQGYEGKGITVSPDGKECVLIMEKPVQKTQCPACGKRCYINASARMTLKDMPISAGCRMSLLCLYHQYECPHCGKTFKDEVPFAYPGTRITMRAAGWIRMLLAQRMSVRAIQEMTGIHWDTIHKVQKEMVETALEERDRRWKAEQYRPRLLAVDEFAIHKGHSYATCVLDLESGDAIWVGKGRAKADFARFFEEMAEKMGPDFLSEVQAVAMDMNASYNLLVKEHLPHAQIVYDRFHMQAQFGREVLGVVRLAQAREHKANADAIRRELPSDASAEQKRDALARSQQESRLYRSLKRLRWPLLSNRANLSQPAADNLDALLAEHADLAVCHAMKEDMCRLFALRDLAEARRGWERWFSAASESGIPALIKFARLKQNRIDGLVSHALFPISTGKLEGFNNKVKLVKRIAFGFRDESFFFAIVTFCSARLPLHYFP